MDTNLNNELQEQNEINKINKFNNDDVDDDDNQQAVKKPEKQNRFLGSTLVTFLMLLLLAVVSVSSYEPIKDNFLDTADHTKAYLESNDFIYTLTRLTYYLKETTLQDNNWHDHRYENLESIKYYIGDPEKTFSKSNIAGMTEQILPQEMEKSQFYLKIKFDLAGQPVLESSLGNKFNQEAFLAGLNIHNNEKNKLEYADLQIVYFIPADIAGFDDLFTDNMQRFYMPKYLLLISVIGAVGIILLIIITLAIPYSVQRRITLCQFYNKMLLEFKLLFLFGFGFIFFGGTIFLGNNYLFGMNNIIDVISSARPAFYVIGIPITFILYLFIYLTVVYLKYVYEVGFKEGFIKNNILGKGCCYFLNQFSGLFQEVIALDFNKDAQKQLFISLGINLIVLWVIAATGFVGFILAIFYTIFLFKYLLKLIGEAKAINMASSQLAAGDFTVNLEENLGGILNPIAKNLNNIKEGFKLAVDQEIKSQKMKAELISNVSHDLKTPLTSIINYVDLLKKEEISQENKKKYLEILEQKSQRLKVLIEDLFEASKVSSGNVELHLERVDVIALFRQTFGELEEKLNQSTLHFKTNVPENKVFCALDGKKTYRVFANIMSNILKYSMANSRVYVDVIESEKEVSFIFKNISAYEMNFEATEITERFTRGDQSRNTEGSGLGLAIAKSLIELQNGNLEITIDGDLFKVTVKFFKAE